MATNEATRAISVLAAISSGVAAVTAHRFAKFKASPTEKYEVERHVPGANGAAAQGIISMKPDTKNVTDGFVALPLTLPGGQTLLEMREAVSAGDAIRIGGDSSEEDGAGYAADASGDVIVAYAMEDASVGQIISILFTGYSGTVA